MEDQSLLEKINREIEELENAEIDQIAEEEANTQTDLPSKTEIEKEKESAFNRHKNRMDHLLARKLERKMKIQKNRRSKQDELAEIMSKPLEQITDVLAKGESDPEFRLTSEYATAARELDVRKKEERKIAARNRKPGEFTEEDRRRAGYLELPKGLEMPSAISTRALRCELNEIAVPMPLDMLLGDMHGQHKVSVIGSDGTNLIDSQGTRTANLLAKEAKLLAGKVNNEEPNDDVADAIIPSINDHIISLPLAQELGITAADIAITEKNEADIEKYLKGNANGLTTVKPFSIPAGIIGQGSVKGKQALIAFDQPDYRTGQPGKLLAIFEKGSFSDAPPEPVAYNPLDVLEEVVTETRGYLQGTNVTSEEALAQEHETTAPESSEESVSVDSPAELTEPVSLELVYNKLLELTERVERLEQRH